MTHASSGPWYWCLIHNRVEPKDGCPNMERMGPFDTRAKAEAALERAHQRTEEWDKADREWEGR